MMDKFIFVYYFVFLMTVHSSFVISQDDQGHNISSLLSKDRGDSDSGSEYKFSKHNDGNNPNPVSDLSNGYTMELQSTQRIDQNDFAAGNKSKLNVNIDPELPSLFIDQLESKDNIQDVKDKSGESHEDGDVDVAVEPVNQLQTFDKESEKILKDETTTSSLGNQVDAEKGIIPKNNLTLDTQEQPQTLQELSDSSYEYKQERKFQHLAHKNSQEKQYIDQKQFHLLKGLLHKQGKQPVPQLSWNNLEQPSPLNLKTPQQRIPEWLPKLSQPENQFPQNQQADEVKDDDINETYDDDSSDTDASDESEKSDQYWMKTNSANSDEDKGMPQQLSEPKKQELSTHIESIQQKSTADSVFKNKSNDFINVGNNEDTAEDIGIDDMEDINIDDMGWIYDSEDPYEKYDSAIGDYMAAEDKNDRDDSENISDDDSYEKDKFDTDIKNVDDPKDTQKYENEEIGIDYSESEIKTDDYESVGENSKIVDFEDVSNSHKKNDKYDSAFDDKDDAGDMETSVNVETAKDDYDDLSDDSSYKQDAKTLSDNASNKNDDFAEILESNDSTGQTDFEDNVANKEDDSSSSDSNPKKTKEDKLQVRIINPNADIQSSWQAILKDLSKDNTDEDDWFDKEDMDSEEEYTESEENKDGIDVEKEENEADGLGEHGSDDNDDDEEYYITKWTHDDDDETEWVGNNDDVEDDFDESKNHIADEIVDETAKTSKTPTAPSMVLFYTWMIVAVLIIIVGISTYQSRCRGFRFPGTKAAPNPKDDRKRLIEHEFV